MHNDQDHHDHKHPYSEENCFRCDPTSDAFSSPLFETDHFRVVCDHHPIVEGHILIISKHHYSCMGEFPEEVFLEFAAAYDRVCSFIMKHYGVVSTFEHGILGQTVPHAHVHILPYGGDALEIVPEGLKSLVHIPSMNELRGVYDRFGRYLFFTILDRAFVVDPALAAPRFFRDRFAKALGKPERGDWKKMQEDEKLMKEAAKGNNQTQALWRTQEPHHQL